MFSIMRKHKMIIFISISVVLVLLNLFFNQRLKDSNDIAATVNGEPVYEKEIEDALSRHKETDITREDIIIVAAKEILVIQEAEKLGIVISSNELDEGVKTLEEEYPKFYELAIDQYKDISAYKEALRYRMIYESVKDKIISEYVEENPLDDEMLKQEMVQEGVISEEDFNDKKYDDLKSQFIRYNNLKRGNEHFEEWTNSLLITAKVKYVSTQKR